MKDLSKICDAADWFDPEIQYVVQNELKETARFHRKQWEFAMIFLTLKKLGFLNEDKIGLSLGGGSERVLYSIARYVKKLYVTDLYDSSTTWDCARTNDPDEFIRRSKPFDYDESRVKALRMDMRSLDFEDNSFDFCYSSCALEHIGDLKDFIAHFDEVYRCLKADGIYVFTTELSLGNRTIQDSNNYIFSPEYMKELIRQTKLTPVFDPDLFITNHIINLPYPSNLSNMCFENGTSLSENLLTQFPHLVLMRGKYPFTSILVVLRKKAEEKSKRELSFRNLHLSSDYFQEGIESFNRMLNASEISFNPFSSLPDGTSHFFQDHSTFFQNLEKKKQDSETIFHTDYFWLGKGERNFSIKTTPELISRTAAVQIRVHRYPVLASQNVECVFEDVLLFEADKSKEVNFTLKIEDEYSYAILGKLLSGNFRVKDISLRSRVVSSPDIEQVNTGILKTSEVND